MEIFNKEKAASPARGEAAKEETDCCANNRQPAAQAQGIPIPDDPRVLRLIMALADVMVYDRSGAESLKSYNPLLETLEAVIFVYCADAVTIQRAVLRAMAANGDLPPAAEVLRFPEGGSK